MWTVLVRAGLLTAAIAVADYAWNRHGTEKQLEMSKQSVEQEHKHSEGDPLIRSQLRRRALELSRNRMLREVASADVVVTNPTHLAVALRYAAGDPAPKVVARGADHVALRIRREAYRHGVPVTGDRPLARALYTSLGSHRSSEASRATVASRCSSVLRSRSTASSTSAIARPTNRRSSAAACTPASEHAQLQDPYPSAGTAHTIVTGGWRPVRAAPTAGSSAGPHPAPVR